MTMPTDRIRAQVALVEEHVGRENAHDLAGIMATFGQQAWYDDEPWGEHHEGREAVHDYYEDLLTSLPDLHIDIAHCLAAEEGVALEVRISGTHLGPWRGLPPTGRRVSFPPLRALHLRPGRTAGRRAHLLRPGKRTAAGGPLPQPSILPRQDGDVAGASAYGCPGLCTPVEPVGALVCPPSV